MPISPPVAIVGGGNMAQAIVRAGIDVGVLDPARLIVADPEHHRREHFRTIGIAVVESAAGALAWLSEFEAADASSETGEILLAVKPQSLESVGAELIAPLRTGEQRRVVMSILAGATSQRIRAALGDSDVGIVRLMPNLAVQIRRGTTALALGAGAIEGDEDVAAAIFSALGRIVRIEEGLMNAFTAVAGSGPAYVFFLAEAMMRAAMEVGFDRDTAQWLSRWTLTGAAALLDATDQPPGTLRAAVTSRGGTTEAAMQVLDEAKVMEAFTRAIRAARDRGEELGR